MLQSIHLHNFQTHADRTIELDPAVTTLIGPSDAGKSSILRALKLAALNQWDGPANSFVRWGNYSAEIELKADDHSVVRHKGESTNTYELDGQEYKAFGQSVPEVIAKLLNLSPLNFQGQFDSPYWLSCSPGQVSRELNSVINLDLIDRTLGNIASAVRKARTEVDVDKERLQKAKAAVAELAWVDAMVKALEALEAKEKEAVRLRDTEKELTEILEKCRKARAAVRIIPNDREMETLRRTRTAVVEAAGRESALSALLFQIELGRDELEAKRKKADAAKAELGKAMGNRCPLCKKPVKEVRDGE